MDYGIIDYQKINTFNASTDHIALVTVVIMAGAHPIPSAIGANAADKLAANEANQRNDHHGSNDGTRTACQ